MLKHSGLPVSVCELANLIFLVDRVDALRACSEGREESSLWRKKIASHSGSLFCPDLVEIFLAASDNGNWFSLDSEPLELFFHQLGPSQPGYGYGFSALLELAQMFASIVDGKSRFTYHHSLGVCAVARLLAEVSIWMRPSARLWCWPPCCTIWVNSRVDDTILDKPGAFDATEAQGDEPPQFRH